MRCLLKSSVHASFLFGRGDIVVVEDEEFADFAAARADGVDIAAGLDFADGVAPLVVEQPPDEVGRGVAQKDSAAAPREVVAQLFESLLLLPAEAAGSVPGEGRA